MPVVGFSGWNWFHLVFEFPPWVPTDLPLSWIKRDRSVAYLNNRSTDSYQLCLKPRDLRPKKFTNKEIGRIFWGAQILKKVSPKNKPPWNACGVCQLWVNWLTLATMQTVHFRNSCLIVTGHSIRFYSLTIKFSRYKWGFLSLVEQF